MPALNTRHIAQLLGAPARIYHQDFTQSPSFTANTVLSLPQMILNDTSVAAMDRLVQRDGNGLHIEFTRPEFPGNMGIFAVLPLMSKTLQSVARVVLTARFQRPQQRILPQGEDGTFAAALLMSLRGSIGGDLIGASSQFRTNGQRLNAPGIGITPRDPISSSLTAEVTDAQNPAIFTLVFFMIRETAPSWGQVRLYVNDTEADQVRFDFPPNILTNETTIADFRVGLGTASGFQYTCSVNVLDFEVWVTDAAAQGNSFNVEFNEFQL